MKILVTGATGFLGAQLVPALSSRSHSVVSGTRSPERVLGNSIPFQIDDLNAETDWSGGLVGVDVVVHCAARAHILEGVSADTEREFETINVQGTLNLARQAIAAGVKRFVFISSIKVNGEETLPGEAFTEIDRPQPRDAYGRSKHEAEKGLSMMSESSNFDVVIIRPPLVYGPGVKANFLKLTQLVSSGIPLPLGAIHNRRSLIAVGNLVDFICVCTESPQAANEIFLISDGEDVSTTKLLVTMYGVLGQSVRLIPFPARLLRIVCRVVGKGDVATRLCGSLQADISKARRLLSWKPPITLLKGIGLVVKDCE
ncbi:hypothetical protein A9Q99_02460 [Gammaproteobacteria bacterium 45_16_T64]|nr:hypothetical protein A9Q99_02460 [Gammaproteobacteria bacterium 45_16_T64]